MVTFLIGFVLAVAMRQNEAANIAQANKQMQQPENTNDNLDEAESAESSMDSRDFDDEEDSDPQATNGRPMNNNNNNQYAPNSMGNQNDQYNEDKADPAESNIANAKIHLSSQDMATAAGHHHHHGHYPHGMLKMGAHTGKKGSFGWHDKHPVGGKGRR